MKNSKKFLVGLLGLGIAWCCTSSASGAVKQEDLAGIALSLHLPITAVSRPEESLNLVVDIPKGFKSLQKNLMESKLEFVPEGDNAPFKWSEHIGTKAIIGKRVSAQFMTDILKQGIVERAKQVTILKEKSSDRGSFVESCVTISYTVNDRPELLFAKSFSGPYDMAGFQYSIALTDAMTLYKAVQKIREFNNNNINVVKF